MTVPLAIDLFCGLGGWAEGFLAEGYDVIGFDIERPDYGTGGYPGQLVIQDVLTLHGSQFKDAAVIVASPPCQKYSYMAMPWSRAKKIAEEYRSGVRDVKNLTALFDACFRIQREACEAAGRFIPLIVENVRGAQPWVGRSQWHYGSFHLWGDVPALMPMTAGRKNTGGSWFNVAHNTTSGLANNQRDLIASGLKLPGNNGPRRLEDRDVQRLADATKGSNGGWFNDNKRDGKSSETGYLSRSGSKSDSRKAASAQIAKIPFPLARHIARTFRPQSEIENICEGTTK